MKIALLLMLTSCCLLAVGQEKVTHGSQDLYTQIEAMTARPDSPHLQFTNRLPPISQKGSIQHSQFRTGNRTTNQQRFPNNQLSNEYPSSLRTMGTCLDTSYSRLLSIPGGMIYMQSATQTRDGGVLIAALMYDSTNAAGMFWKDYGLLIKLDGSGNLEWLKEFKQLTTNKFSDVSITRAFELSNGDIICTGYLDPDPQTDVYETLVYRLTNKGDIIWENSLKSTISIFNSPTGTFTYRVENVAEGLNGDIILCGTSNSNYSSGKIETVVRLNNLGKPVWDANYGNHGITGAYLFGAEGVSVFVKNGQIILVGLSHGTNYPPISPAVTILTLDYNNGDQLSKRFFRPDYPDKREEYTKGFTYFSNKCIQLENGNYLFYGKVASEFIDFRPEKEYFGVIEFDPGFNLVNAYTLSSGIKTNYYNNVLHFDASGRGLISLLEYIDYFEGNVFFGSFSNGQFLKQRKVHYTNAGMPGSNGFAFLKDNGYVYLQTYFQDQPVTRNYLEFRKMHNSDTTSACMGKDTTLMHFLPLHIIEDPDYWLLDPNEPGKIVEIQQTIAQAGDLTTSSLDLCKQTSYCDTVKIHGDSLICGSAGSMLFTAFKNKACGTSVQWIIDPSAQDSMQVVSDTSVRIWFKNNNWQGKLYAMLAPGACYAPVTDSINLHIVRSQVAINLGSDTALCNGNSLVLHAGASFTNYQWQDGSKDSTISVNTPGLYWVQANDFCGNSFRDSVNVIPFTITIDLGPDRTKCNTDTLHLEASAGFLNYTWSNNYNISSTTSQTVVVNPLTDTAYYIKAEKTPGCFAYDTVSIKVNHSSPIDLGTDKSFCSGDSAVFNAGSGFTKYLWSTGATTRQITVNSMGGYAVMATNANGCKSYDTVKVLAVFANPIVSLDKGNTLCMGTSKILDAGSFSSYKWIDGSTSRTLSVNNTGIYAVQVQDVNGCKGSDTTVIKELLPIPGNFLPADTAICSYGSLTLTPSAVYNSYLWSNNSAAPSITIKEPGRYWLQVKDVNQCSGSDTILVNAKDCMNGFYVPTAFTPNGDGKNDAFRPLLFGNIKKYSFTVYNRWGQVIFQTTELAKGWKGTFASSQQDSNVFAWSCTYQLEGQEVKTEKGTVVLIR